MDGLDARHHAWRNCVVLGKKISDPDEGLETIAEMSARYGLSLRSLRFYEQLEMLAPIRLAGRRFYRPRDEIVVQLIAHGKKLGLTLSEIDRTIRSNHTRSKEGDIIPLLSKKQVSEKIDLLVRKRDEIDFAVEELRILAASSVENESVETKDQVRAD